MAAQSINITAVGDQVSQPILWRMARLFHVVPSILKARVTNETAFMTVAIEGSTSQFAAARAYLASLGLVPVGEVDLSLPSGLGQRPEESISSAYTLHVRLDVVQAQYLSAPILYRLGRDFDVVCSVIGGDLDDTGGWIEVALTGRLGEVQRAIAFLHTTGIHVDPRERSVTDFSNL